MKLDKYKILYISLFLFLIQGIVQNLGHPVTPTYVTNLGINEEFFGYFFSAMSFGLLLGAPIWGVLGDINSKKKYIIIGMSLYALGQFAFGFFENEYIMIFVRFFSGVAAASGVTLMNAHFISISKPEERTRNLSMSVAFMMIGSSLGYYIGGLIGNYYIKEAFYIQAGAVLLYVLIFSLLFKEVKRKSVKVSKNSLIEGFTNIKYLSFPLIIFMITLTLISIASMNISKFSEVFMINELLRTTEDLGTWVLVTGFVGIFTNLVIVPILSKNNKNLILMIFNMLLSTIIIIITFSMNDMYLSLYSVFMVYVVMKSSFQPLEINYIASQNKGEKYGLIMGVRQSFMAIGYVVGPIIGGFLYKYNPLYTFFLSAILFFIAFISLISLYIFKKKNGLCLDNVSKE